MCSKVGSSEPDGQGGEEKWMEPRLRDQRRLAIYSTLMSDDYPGDRRLVAGKHPA